MPKEMINSQTEEKLGVVLGEVELVEELHQHSSEIELGEHVLVSEADSYRNFAERVVAANGGAQNAYFAAVTAQKRKFVQAGKNLYERLSHQRLLQLSR